MNKCLRLIHLYILKKFHLMNHQVKKNNKMFRLNKIYKIYQIVKLMIILYRVNVKFMFLKHNRKLHKIKIYNKIKMINIKIKFKNHKKN